MTAPDGPAPSEGRRDPFDEYVAELEAGNDPNPEVFADRCADESERERFGQLVSELQNVDRLLPPEPRRPDPLVGYQLHEEIASGGMGVVYRATDSNGRDVAVKWLSDSLLTDEEALRRFDREVEVLALLDHPGIVRVLDHGAHGSRPYLVMELLPGGTLLDRIRARNVLPGAPSDEEIREACHIVADIARAAASAQRAGVVHRDIKPSNVLFDDSGRARLSDFGLARLEQASSLTSASRILGTASYLAPERLLDIDADADPRVDVYSLGVTLFETIAGMRPFEGSLPQILAAVRAGPPRLRAVIGRDVDDGLEAILERCLSDRPTERYADAEQLAEELERWLVGEPVRARRGRRRRRLKRALRLHPWRVAAGSAIGLAVLIAGSVRVAEARESQRLATLVIEAERPRVAEFVQVTEDIWTEIDQTDGGRNDWDQVAWVALGRDGVRDRHVAMADLQERAEEIYRESYEALSGVLIHGDAGHDEAATLLGELKAAAALWRERDGRFGEADLLWRAADRVHPEGVVRPDARLTVSTRPAGAAVVVERYVDPQAGAVRALERVGDDDLVTPVRDLRLEPGSYRLRLRAPDAAAEIPLPVLLLSGDEVEFDEIELPRDEELDEEWVYVAPGAFVAGGDPRALGSEVRSVRTLDGFFIQRRELTFADYMLFLRELVARGVPCFDDDPVVGADWPEGLPLHVPRDTNDAGPRLSVRDILETPRSSLFGLECAVHQISPFDAQHFVRWRNKVAERDGEPWVYSLPTGDQWEKAARGADGRAFAWGDEFRWDYCASGFARALPSYAETRHMMPGGHPLDRSPFGLLDVTGNVREICADVESENSRTLVRGGEESFYTADEFRLAARRGAVPMEFNWDFGFRLVRHRR